MDKEYLERRAMRSPGKATWRSPVSSGFIGVHKGQLCPHKFWTQQPRGQESCAQVYRVERRGTEGERGEAPMFMQKIQKKAKEMIRESDKLNLMSTFPSPCPPFTHLLPTCLARRVSLMGRRTCSEQGRGQMHRNGDEKDWPSPLKLGQGWGTHGGR